MSIFFMKYILYHKKKKKNSNAIFFAELAKNLKIWVFIKHQYFKINTSLNEK